MSLEHAILGFLQYQPASGYDLKGLFDLSVQHFWPADQSQIYRTLARLSERGWAKMEVIEQQDRPDRKVYRITDGGRTELRRWLGTPASLGDGRSPLLVQVFFAGQLPDGELLEILRRAAAECRESLEHLRRVPEECREQVDALGSPREVWCWMLTLECGIRATESKLAWLESVIARIERGEVPAPAVDGGMP